VRAIEEEGGMIETIYMPLLNENVEVWAPVQAESLGSGRYRILGPRPDDEEWAFSVGSVVNARMTCFSGGESGMAAFENSN